MAESLLAVLTVLRQRISRCDHLLLGLDFDGTLAPLQDWPERVVLPPETQQEITALTEQHKITVAILSGRALVDLKPRVRIPNVTYAGNHGLEINGRQLTFTEPTAIACREELRALGERLAREIANVPGAAVEDKALTLTIHMRRVAPEAHDEVRRIVHLALAGTDHPFLLTQGDNVLDIRPRAGWNKATALRWIQERIGKDSLVIYIGDDTTDEDVFTEFTDAVTIKVGRGVETAAHYTLENPEEVRKFLGWVHEQLAQ